MNPVRFGSPTPKPHPGRPHKYSLLIQKDGVAASYCFCGKQLDEAKVRQGRSNLNRGKSFEREVCRKLGISRVGQYGGKEDGGKADEWIMVQTKVGNATYPTRIDALLRAIPFRSDQLRAVVHGDAPGSAGKRRALITLDLDEFAAWFGEWK